jgi:hypothetical protein
MTIFPTTYLNVTIDSAGDLVIRGIARKTPLRSIPLLLNNVLIGLLYSGGPGARVEADSNTSTVALRVVGGDEKEALCLGV